MVVLFSPVVTADVRRYQSDWDRALGQLKGWAELHGVPVLDMTKFMAVDDPQKIYFDGVHLRPTGDQIVADAFIERFGPELTTK